MRHFFKEHSLVNCKGSIRTFTNSNLECNTDCMDCGGWDGVQKAIKFFLKKRLYSIKCDHPHFRFLSQA